MIPGLLQTEAYARAILQTHPDATEDLVSERLYEFCKRQVLRAVEQETRPRRSA